MRYAHSMPRPALVLALSLAPALIAGRAHASGGALPPLEIEVGSSAISTHGGADVAATEVLVGLSFASLYPKPTPVDVSLGWMGSFVPGDDDPVVGSPASERATTGRKVEDASGAFLALDLRAAEGRHWRAWLGGRAELLATEDVGVLGGFGRASIELWHPVATGDGGGGIIGAVALSAWMELGARERPDRSLARVASAGIGIRLPLIAAR